MISVADLAILLAICVEEEEKQHIDERRRELKLKASFHSTVIDDQPYENWRCMVKSHWPRLQINLRLLTVWIKLFQFWSEKLSLSADWLTVVSDVWISDIISHMMQTDNYDTICNNWKQFLYFSQPNVYHCQVYRSLTKFAYRDWAGCNYMKW